MTYVAFVGAACDSACRLLAALCLPDKAYPEASRRFPPEVEWLQVWSTLFRHAGTFGNYLGYVKTGCLLVGASVEVPRTTVSHVPLLRRQLRYLMQGKWQGQNVP